MTPANPDALADAPYVLLKRGLFERPGHHGYTGVLRHAGRFSHEEASAYAVHGGSVTMMLASEAPAYSPACWHETQVEDLLDLLRIEREAKATAEARAAQLQAEVEALKEDRADAERTVEQWFDTKAKSVEQIRPKLAEALGGYLRVCRCGGMSAEESELVEATLGDFLRRQSGSIVAPVVETMVAERLAARTALAARAATAREG